MLRSIRCLTELTGQFRRQIRFRSITDVRRSRRARQRRSFGSESLEPRALLAASGIQALHRSGQTFVTWQEDTSVTGEQYHIYRHTALITNSNLGQARKLTWKWGALDDNTSVNVRAAEGVPAHYVISDLVNPLSDSQGLFVYTTQPGDSGTFYYAVTQVTGGTESLSLTSGQNSLASGVTESVAATSPVLTVSVNNGKGRIYTQYMDYSRWNPTFQGYAYNYSVAIPANYSHDTAWPLKLMPHAYGERMRLEPESEYGWQCIQLFLDDPGGGDLGYQTWWYGFAADHNYRTGGQTPTTGHVENFSEQRVLKAIDEVSAIFNVDQLRIHSQGNSMGASGSLSLGMRYPNMFAGIFASEPMTNYGASPLFQDDFTSLWGSQASNLPTVNNGPYAAPLKKYDGIGVYTWMNHHQQPVSRRGDDMAFLMVGHGKADDVIDWATQGRPFIAALNAGNVGFTAEQRYGWDHNWMSFDFALDSMFSPADGGLSAWVYPRNLSFPAITNATGSGPADPGTSGTQFYNMTVEWSVPWNNFHTDLVDTSGRYEVSLRSTNGAQVAEVTPRKLQTFSTPAGTSVSWQNVNNATGQVVQSGTVVADSNGVVTIPRFQIGTDTGNRLIMTVNNAAPATPVLTGPALSTESQRPTVTWNPVGGATSFSVWIDNLTTGQSAILRPTVNGTSYTPTSDLGIGRYRIWVQARNSSGKTSAWSVSRTITINTPVAVTGLPATFVSTRPTITWTALPGAVSYELWINNLTTGQTSVVRASGLTGTSYQLPTPHAMGVYAVWVKGVDAAGTGSKWSPAREMTIAPQTVLVAPLQPTFRAQPTFTWQSVPGATRYNIQVHNRTTGAVVIHQTGINGTAFTPASALPNADYLWWIRAVGPNNLMGTWSHAGEFNVGGRPIVLTPPGNTTNSTPTIQWTAVGDTASYELWVSRLSNGAVVINLTGLQSTTYRPTSPLSAGTYRIWVRAVSSTGAKSLWSAPVDITITTSRLRDFSDQILDAEPDALAAMRNRADFDPQRTKPHGKSQRNSATSTRDEDCDEPAEPRATAESIALNSPSPLSGDTESGDTEMLDLVMAEWE